jgi:hypothetical protein
LTDDEVGPDGTLSAAGLPLPEGIPPQLASSDDGDQDQPPALIDEAPPPLADEAKPGPELGCVLIGLGRIQYKGKGSFNAALLSLDIVSNFAGSPVVPQLSVKSQADGKVMRTIDVSGCTVSEPKKQRKGQEHAFRLDVPSKDKKGDSKYVISLDSADQLLEWKEAMQGL